jgi:hypothetical protein
VQSHTNANGISVRYFAKNDNKQPPLRAAADEGGDGKVVLVGIAQEKASAWRSLRVGQKSYARVRPPVKAPQ